MEALFEQLLELLREQGRVSGWDIAIRVASIVAPLISLFATVIAFVVMRNTIKKDQINLESAKKSQMLNSQSLYPILKYAPVEYGYFDTITYGRLCPDGLSVHSVTVEGQKGCEIGVDNGILKSDKKPLAAIAFELENISEAIVTEVSLCKMEMMRPTKLEDNYLHIKPVEYTSDLPTFVSQDLLLKGSKRLVWMLVYLDSEEYVKYYAQDMMHFQLILSMRTLTGLTFFQAITVSGDSQPVYSYGEDEHLKRDRFGEGSIYIA